MNDRYVCGPLCPTVAVHPAVDQWELAASSEWSDVDGWWRNSPYSVLLATGATFDVIEVSARVGAAAVQRVRTVPVAVDPVGRWMFLVASGATLDPDLRASHDTVLHGPGSWIPAPPTRTPGGRIRWELHPAAVGWHIPDARVLQQVLAAPMRLPLAPTTRELRTAA
jgi:bifunctional DNA primase/polymerase-like protein